MHGEGERYHSREPFCSPPRNEDRITGSSCTDGTPRLSLAGTGSLESKYVEVGILTRLARAICGDMVEPTAKHVQVLRTLTRVYDFLGKDWPSRVVVLGICGESVEVCFVILV